MTDVKIDLVGPGARLALAAVADTQALLDGVDIPGLEAGVVTAVDAAATATTAAGVSTAARDVAVAALATTSIANTYPTKAAMDAGAGPLANGVYVQVIADEAQGGARTIYRKVSGVMVFQAFGTERFYAGELLSQSGTIRYRAAMTDIDDGGGNNNRADFAIERLRVFWPANSPGHDSPAPHDYYDDKGVVGYNVNADRTLKNPENAGWADITEPKFWQGGGFGLENQSVFRAPGGPEHRAGQWFMPYDMSRRGKAARSLKVDIINWEDQTGVQVIKWDFDNDVFGVVRGSFVFSTNNVAPVIQLNAAGDAQVKLPYLNSFDQITTERPTFQTAPSIVGTLGFRSVHEGIDTSGAAGSVFSYRLVTGTVAGAYTFDRVAGATTGQLTGKYVYQVGTGQAVGNIVEHAGAGDAVDIARAEGAADFGWSYGMRGSDGAYVLANSKTGSLASRIAIAVPVGANPRPEFPNGIDATTDVHVAGVKVVGAQGAAVADATDAATVITQLNALLARLRTHGLIAS